MNNIFQFSLFSIGLLLITNPVLAFAHDTNDRFGAWHLLSAQAVPRKSLFRQKIHSQPKAASKVNRGTLCACSAPVTLSTMNRVRTVVIRPVPNATKDRWR